VTLISTGAVALIALHAFIRFFLSYRERLTPPLLYLSMFFLFFSLNYAAMFLRAVFGMDMLFYNISNIFGPLALAFIAAFAVSLVWPGRDKISFAFSLPMFVIFFMASLYVDPGVTLFYERVYEVVYPYYFVILTLLTISSLSLFVSVTFFLYALRVRWSALKRGGFMIASGFLVLTVFVYLFDWPGLFGSLLPLTRLMGAVGISLVYLGAMTLQRARIPSF
jgi:hypothetical protein